MLFLQNLFTDATLACDGQFYPVHKFVLSTCSEFFSAMFEWTPCVNPVLVLNNVLTRDLEAILDFMYTGEASVKDCNLEHVMRAAQSLRVQGLAVLDEARPVMHKPSTASPVPSATFTSAGQGTPTPPSNYSSRLLHNSPAGIAAKGIVKHPAEPPNKRRKPEHDNINLPPLPKPRPLSKPAISLPSISSFDTSLPKSHRSQLLPVHHMPASSHNYVPRPTSSVRSSIIATPRALPYALPGSSSHSLPGSSSHPLSGSSPHNLSASSPHPLSDSSPHPLSGSTSHPLSGASPHPMSVASPHPMSGSSPHSVPGSSAHPIPEHRISPSGASGNGHYNNNIHHSSTTQQHHHQMPSTVTPPHQLSRHSPASRPPSSQQQLPTSNRHLQQLLSSPRSNLQQQLHGASQEHRYDDHQQGRQGISPQHLHNVYRQQQNFVIGHSSTTCSPVASIEQTNSFQQQYHQQQMQYQLKQSELTASELLEQSLNKSSQNTTNSKHLPSGGQQAMLTSSSNVVATECSSSNSNTPTGNNNNLATGNNNIVADGMSSKSSVTLMMRSLKNTLFLTLKKKNM